MNGIVISIDPVIWQIGQFTLRWYSVAILVAVVVGVLLAVREARRRGIRPDAIYGLMPWALVAGLVGARLFHAVDQWEYYAGNPLQILQLQQGGLAIWGALAGGGGATIVYAWVQHIPLGRLADAIAPAVLAGQIIGRIGCIVNGDASGGGTSLPWGVIYAHPNSLVPAELYGVPVHPYPIYEILWNAGVLWLILWLRHRLNQDGLIFLTYLSLYSAGRFLLSFVRQENAAFWGLQQAQVLALATIIVSVTIVIYLWRKREVKMMLERIT